ncbi:CBS domain-containing protein [Flexibacterium corallicola]|uniref:CBS domain-containing protein n=1 Tax=Flexibacterium corallicola TaxID=3037259 RepID=UPI00286FACE2|nr:CBS domain-containing protein [Pseudovibrio sp. M1P-2-3]
MTVAAILANKGHRVVVESSECTLSKICQVLEAEKIGAIVICDTEDVIAGIVSERDVVKAISKFGPDILSKPVSEFMTAGVVTCEEGDTINTVMEKMTEGRFRHIPVLQNSKLRGIISIGDAVKFRIAQVEQEAEDMRKYIHTG